MFGSQWNAIMGLFGYNSGCLNTEGSEKSKGSDRLSQPNQCLILVNKKATTNR
jgi:hypothetical protein